MNKNLFLIFINENAFFFEVVKQLNASIKNGLQNVVLL